MFENFNLVIIVLITIIVWLIVLSFLYFRFYSFYSRFTKHGDFSSLSDILKKTFEYEEESKKVLEKLVKNFDKLERAEKLHIQRLGLLRFNPFKETGGDQSFILALLDAEGTGVVISSLHTRTGTRWYAKKVHKEKGLEHDLSDEEQKAIKEAKNIEI